MVLAPSYHLLYKVIDTDCFVTSSRKEIEAGRSFGTSRTLFEQTNKNW